MVLRRSAVPALGAAALLCGTMLAPSAAQATARNGVCESGEFCLYYNSNHQGSLVDFTGSVSSYGTGSGCIKYVGAGSGRGQCVKNNAASAWNRRSSVVTIFYKSGYSGAIDSISGGSKVNIRSSLKNENAGHRYGSGSNTSFEYGVYKNTSAGISAYFDGYLSTSGRHEGVDVVRYSGAPVYSLVTGKVIYKNEGGGGLSTLTIYSSTLNRSIVYLHTNPLNGLSVGQSVSRGQKIATEAARGAGASHTHVEMRTGYKQRAAKSVGDYTLENPIPTSFWMDRGYNICCQ